MRESRERAALRDLVDAAVDELHDALIEDRQPPIQVNISIIGPESSGASCQPPQTVNVHLNVVDTEGLLYGFMDGAVEVRIDGGGGC